MREERVSAWVFEEFGLGYERERIRMVTCAVPKLSAPVWGLNFRG